jgi:cell division protein FtsQ
MRAAVALRRPLATIAPPAHLRPRLAAGLGAFLVLLCLYMFWFRDSGFVRVDEVSITGLTEAPRLREQLAEAAMTMSTLHVRHDRLENVLAGYPAVERVEVDADLPHTLRIDVIERQPAALLVSGRSRMPVAGDGRLLRGLRPETSLPVIKLRGALPSERLGPGTALQAAAVAGAAPLELRRRLSTDIQTKDRGLVARLRKGPDLIFGDTRRLQAKWLAAARVLADKGSQGASYVDLRLPERPAAGGLPVDEAAAGPAPATSAPAAPTTTAPAAPTTTAPAAPTTTAPAAPTTPAPPPTNP